MTDLALAIAHHFLVFLLAGLLAVEFALVRRGIPGETIARLSRIDGLYGGVAGAVVLIGFARVLFGIRGWEYYIYYPVFWLKFATFVVVGLLSIGPTLTIAAWRRNLRANAGFVPPDAEVDRVRLYLNAELAGLGLILIFAAATARNVGY